MKFYETQISWYAFYGMAFPFIVILNLISTLLDQFAKNKIYKKKVKQL